MEENAIEPGFMLIDKSDEKVFDALKYAWFLQKQWKLFSRLIPDGMELIRLAYEVVNAPYYVEPWYPGLIGTQDTGIFCGAALVSYSPNRKFKTKRLQRDDLLFYRLPAEETLEEVSGHLDEVSIIK